METRSTKLVNGLAIARRHKTVLAMAVLIGLVALPQKVKATTFGFDDEYYLRSGAAYSSVFPGATGSAGATGIYQETQDASHGGIIITRLSNGSGVPQEYVQNTTPNQNQMLALFGWGQSLNYGQQVANVYNLQNPYNGTVLYFRYTVGGATTPFTFNSFDLRGATANANLSFTLQGYLNGTMVDSVVLTVTGNTFTTFTENWQNVDTVEIVSTSSLPVNWGSGTLYMDNLTINAVPEPATMAAGALLLLPFGASTLRGRRRA